MNESSNNRFRPRLTLRRLHKLSLTKKLIGNWRSKKSYKYKSSKYSRLKRFKWFRLKKFKHYFNRQYSAKLFSRVLLKNKYSRSPIRKNFIRHNLPQGNLSFLNKLNKELLKGYRSLNYRYLNGEAQLKTNSYKTLLNRLLSTYAVTSEYKLPAAPLSTSNPRIDLTRLTVTSPFPTTYNHYSPSSNYYSYSSPKYISVSEGINSNHTTFSKFTLRYLYLVTKLKDNRSNKLLSSGIYNNCTLGSYKDGFSRGRKKSNKALIFSKGKKLRRRLIKSLKYSNKNKLIKKLHKVNSYSCVINLLSNHIGNPNLYVRSFDLLRFALNKRRSLNKASSFITGKLWFEFGRLEPSFFIDEVVSLILTSIKFKDTNIFMSWFVRFMFKVHIKKHKRVLSFLKKLFRIVYNSKYKDKLRFLGVYFDIRGKVGVSGSKKKRHTCITYGNTSSTNRRLKLVSQKDVVITTTGVLGVTFSIFY